MHQRELVFEYRWFHSRLPDKRKLNRNGAVIGARKLAQGITRQRWFASGWPVERLGTWNPRRGGRISFTERSCYAVIKVPNAPVMDILALSRTAGAVTGRHVRETRCLFVIARLRARLQSISKAVEFLGGRNSFAFCPGGFDTRVIGDVKRLDAGAALAFALRPDALDAGRGVRGADRRGCEQKDSE
jgi:hypothetical protein